MKRITLGQNGTSVAAVGFGAMSLTNFYGPTDEEKSQAILGKVLELGIDHIDTSNAYGPRTSEERIGRFLKDRGAEARDTFKIATKAAITRDADNNRVFDNSPEHLTKELEGSLTRLGVECVELFYVHRRDPRYAIEEVTETLAGLVKAGKTRQVGFSEIAPTSLALANAVHPVGAVQSEYSLSTRSPEMGLVQGTAAIGATMVAFSPVGRGLLTDRPPSLEKCQQLDFMKGNPRFVEPNRTRNEDATAPFRKLAADMGTSAAALSIAWLLHQGDHVLPIPGTRSPEHLAEVAAGGSLELSESDLAAIDAILPIGWCHGDRYSVGQWVGPEKYC